MAYQILLVDDDDEFREEMRFCLDKYDIIEAENGQKALDILRKPHAIDLVVLDVVMPGVLGTEILKQIKKLCPKLPVIIMTGNSSKDVVIDSLQGHADDYIEKPFEISYFLEVINKILKGPGKSLGTFDNKFDRAKTFIERNFDKKISLEDVAQQVCLSPKYMSRFFKEKSGQGFNEFRLKVKIHKAAKLLVTTDCTIDQLSNQLGYKNPESFIRMFEKIMGRTPTQHRISSLRNKRK